MLFMTSAAKRYAEAIFQTAYQRGEIDVFEAHMKEMEETVKALPPYFLYNPAIGTEDIGRALEALFYGYKPELVRFAGLLYRYRHLDELSDIRREFISLNHGRENVLEADITFAQKPEPNTVERLKAGLILKHRAAGVYERVKVDPSILGGFIIDVKGTRYDKSVRGALTNMAKSLKRGESALNEGRRNNINYQDAN